MAHPSQSEQSMDWLQGNSTWTSYRFPVEPLFKKPYLINSHFRNLDWRYLPYKAYIRPIYVREYPQHMAKHMVLTYRHWIGCWNSHWFDIRSKYFVHAYLFCIDMVYRYSYIVIYAVTGNCLINHSLWIQTLFEKVLNPLNYRKL